MALLRPGEAMPGVGGHRNWHSPAWSPCLVANCNTSRSSSGGQATGSTSRIQRLPVVKLCRSNRGRERLAIQRKSSRSSSSGEEVNPVQDAEGAGGLADLPRPGLGPGLGVAVHEPGDVVAGKYTILRVLGQGGLGTTYEAQCLAAPGERVALKAISLRNMKGWKELDLFEREARVLKSLRHPGIPEYVDYFEVDAASDRSFYIAQKVARGRTLAQLIQGGWRGSEQEVRRIAVEVLEVVRYLGSLRPAVIHRDIKPENIILEEEADGGTVKLVDFGGVQDAASTTLASWSSSTVAIVGTWGYMAPEQFQNRATLQTDLYGVGATLLFLLSGRAPASFPQKRLKVDFRDSVAMSPELADIVEKLLEPAPEDRFQSAAEAIAALQQGSSRVVPVPLVPGEGGVGVRKKKQPAGSRVSLRRTQQGLEITIPATGLSAEMAGTGSFAVAWNAFLVCWTGIALAGAAPLMAAASLPFWVVGAGLARSTLRGVGEAVSMHFSSDGRGDFSIRRSVGPWELEEVRGRLVDVSSLDLVAEGEINGRPLTACRIEEGVRSHIFGSGLQTVEKEWLLQELSAFLGLPPVSSVHLPRRKKSSPEERVNWLDQQQQQHDNAGD